MTDILKYAMMTMALGFVSAQAGELFRTGEKRCEKCM